VDEDRLSPQLGRLIDEAKTAAAALGVATAEAEGVALLTEDGAVHSGAGGRSRGAAAAEGNIPGRASLSAAGLALQNARATGDREILAAAVAAPCDSSETVLPGMESYKCLVEVDPEMPLVLKQHGRWVVLPLSVVQCGS
jgi:hypothetical protein